MQITVTAKDYAPQRVQPTPNQPLKIVLSPGRTLSGHVADPGGAPLRGAEIRLQQWRGYAPIDLHVATDAQGNFQLPHAPDDYLNFSVEKQGFQDADLDFTPSQTTASIKLIPSVTFSGNVVDADTKKPIPTFQAFPGALWPGWSGPIFSASNQPDYLFHNGVYNLHASGFGGTINAWYVRIEADGYYPQTGNPVRNGGKAPQDFQLHRGPDLQGTLVDSSGKPVPNAPLTLLIPCSSANVFNGDFGQGNEGHHTRTDSHGTFHFRPQTGPIEIWAATSDGYAESRRDGADTSPANLKLIPWAAIHVRALSAKSPSDEGWSLNIDPGVNKRDPLNFSHWSYSQKPSADGTATFNRIPVVGDGLTTINLFGPNSQRYCMIIRLASRKTTEIDRATGVTLTGQLVPAPGVSIPAGQQQLNLQPLPDTPPAQWPAEWTAAAMQSTSTQGYYIPLDAEGKFTANSLAPGKYEYYVRIPGPEFACSAGTVTIPNFPGDHPTFDLGSITISKCAPAKVGDPAPPILGRTLDDRPIRVQDFPSRFIICFYWDDDYSQLQSNDPAIAALASRFANDKRVALVALNCQRAWGSGLPPIRPPTLPFPWLNGYVSMTDIPTLASLNSFGSSNPLLFIITPDAHLAAVNIPPDQIPSTLTKLLQNPN